MICPHCGAALGAGLERCNCCGGTLKIRQPQYRDPQEQPPQYQPPQPQYQPPVYTPPRPGTESRKTFFCQLAPKKLKIQWHLVTVTLVLALILIAVGVLFPMVRPILRIPSVSGMLSVAGVSVRDITDLIDAAYDELSQEYELGYWDGKELDMAEDLLDTLDRFSGSFNLLELSKLTNGLRNEYDGILRQYLGASEMRVLDVVAKLPTIAIIAIGASFLLPLIFTLLAGLKKNLGFTIAAMILTLLPMLIINGWAFGTATLVIFIPQCVFCSNIRKSYKDYQLGYIR